MWRSFFLAIGVYLMLAGVQCLGVERFYLRIHGDPPPASSMSLAKTPAEGPAVEYPPAPWVPWSLLTGGAVVCLYSFTIPKRMGK
jgi:hypothetical protein